MNTKRLSITFRRCRQDLHGSVRGTVFGSFLLVFLAIGAFGQSWTREEMNQANTAAGIGHIPEQDREIIKYLNLARLFPARFAQIEVVPYLGGEKYGNYLRDSPYKTSLLEELYGRQPVKPLVFHSGMYELAVCFARESGRLGTTGHNRRDCRDGYFGECCSYGMDNGREVVLQLLIDHDVPSLGHRRICLSDEYSGVGPHLTGHAEWDHCAVLDFTY